MQHTISIRTLLASTALLLAALPAYAGPADDAMNQTAYVVEEQQEGDIMYMSGGIGDEERTYMEGLRKNYNLHITSANKNGAFRGNTNIIIYDKTGDELLNTQADPIFYAKLPKGSYKIVAKSRNHTVTKNVTVGKKPANIDIAL